MTCDVVYLRDNFGFGLVQQNSATILNKNDFLIFLQVKFIFSEVHSFTPNFTVNILKNYRYRNNISDDRKNITLCRNNLLQQNQKNSNPEGQQTSLK